MTAENEPCYIATKILVGFLRHVHNDITVETNCIV